MRNISGDLSRGSVFSAGLLVLGAISICSKSSDAAQIELLNWAPVPDSVNPPFAEINYTAAGLRTGPGAIGNGDGNLPPTNQTPGGLQSDTTVTAPIPFSFPSSLFTGGTGYYDTTLTFTGLVPVGPAIQTPIAPGITQDSQLLGPGAFTLTSTAPAGPVAILTGTIAGSTIVTGVDGGTAGATFNANGITYTGGVIIGALPANAVLSGNDMSISIAAITPPFGVGPAPISQLNPFTADATGQFDVNVVPEPAFLGLLAIGALGILARRRGR